MLVEFPADEVTHLFDDTVRLSSGIDPDIILRESHRPLPSTSHARIVCIYDIGVFNDIS
jgi:hypothetical protein